MTFSIDNYSLGLCDDHYIIGHFNDLSPEDQRTVLTFLDNMESLKKALPSDNNVSDELIAYADDVVNAMANHILTTSDTNYRGCLAKIEKLNHMFETTNIYREIFANRIKQTTLETIETEKDNDALQDAKDANTSEPLQDIFNRLNTIVADMTISQIDNQTIIDELAQGFIKDFTEKARKNYSPFD